MNASFAAALADVNGDGKLDVVASDGPGGNVNVLLGNGDGTLQTVKVNQVVAGSAEAIVVADFDGDSQPDAAIGGIGAAYVALGNGDGTFRLAKAWSTGSGDSHIGAGDFDGDGRLDLVTTNSDSNDVTVLLNRSK